MNLNKISFWLIGIFSSIVGFYPLMYFIIDRKFGLLSTKTEALLSNTIWNIGFYGHILFGGLALLIGWLQFSTKIRKNSINVHRKIGITYVCAVLVSGICGIFIGFNATGGMLSKVGFISLGVIWLSSTLAAFFSIKNNDVSAHQKYMVISYAACFSAVTLRLWLPLLVFSMGEFTSAYRIVAWVSWVPNILIALFINSRKKSSLQI